MTYRPIDEQNVPFQFRPGVGGFPGWGGMHLDGDPGSVPANEFRWAENVRFDSGIVYGRAGLSQLGSVEHPVNFVGNFPCECPHKRMWIRIRGCLGVGAGTGCTLAVYDPEGSPIFQNHSLYFGPVDTTEVVAGYGDTLFIGHNDVLRDVAILQPKGGVTMTVTGSSLAHNPLRRFSGFRLVCMLEYPEINTFFIGLQDVVTPANGKIVSYNGLTFRDEYTGFAPIQLGRWRNQIIATFVGSIRWRDNTSSTWTNVAFGGFTCSSSQNAIGEYEALTFIAGGADIIYSWDGAAIAVARTIPTCSLTANKGVMAIAPHLGHLYYLWNDNTGFGMKIGKHDNDNNPASNFDWVDTYVDLEAQSVNFNTGAALASYRGTLFAGCGATTLLGSNPNDVRGTPWIVVSGGGGGGNFPIDSLYVF